MTAKIILLNGVGSAGKSTLAKAIQAAARSVFLHVQMDTWLEMMPGRTLGTPDGLTFQTSERDEKPVITVLSGPAQERALRGMRHAVAAMAAQGCNMVVDEVLFGDVAWSEYHALLKPYAFHTVGVFAPLDVLEAREKSRGDRALGLARGQFDVVHRGRSYDFTVDTTAASADECALSIVRRFGL
ncbi:MAG: AAA family ATPase [Alphaproteobacteria bacterium]|nr:AAA family ATPase [Alphaproteobacteria bacterium]MBL6936792.1 AAA family ATPase [Alphaproteobacteria bacterium]MBL7097561.1 AAA family ATPase [Alphaproteobacteria bacterium]